jgi:ATP-citrate lyase beta-subunit
MGKVLEIPAKRLIAKYGVRIPKGVTASTAKFSPPGKRLVVKAHAVIGGRGKRGLVKVCETPAEAKTAAEKMLAVRVDGHPVEEIMVEEAVDYRPGEHFVALTESREGLTLFLAADVGGVDVESVWNKVQKTSIDVGDAPDLTAFARKAGFDGDARKVARFLSQLVECFWKEDAEYVEINPFVFEKKSGDIVALDAVLKLDGDARDRHPEWDFEFSEFGAGVPSASDKKIAEVDAKIKGSVKLITLKGGGKIAILPAGGGASLFTADAVVRLGGTLANYAEYSGNPPGHAVQTLSEVVFNLPGITDVIINGGIANFTDVYKTFGGIIAAMRSCKKLLQKNGVRLWVRRGGPNEAVGLPMIAKLADEGFKIKVYDRHTGLTDVVDMAIEAQKKGGARK